MCPNVAAIASVSRFIDYRVILVKIILHKYFFLENIGIVNSNYYYHMMYLFNK